MTGSLTNHAEKRGLPPGSLIHIGHVLEAVTRMSVIDYSKTHLLERQIESLEEILEFRDSDSTTWVIVEGLRDVGIIEKIGLQFGIHPLVLEDILNTHQRPKLEEYDNYLYIVLKSLRPETETFSVNYEQISLVVMENFVFTFKEKTDDLLQPIMQRIRNSKGRIKSQGADYLTYAILDTVVDQNFVLIDALDEMVTTLEDELYSHPTQETLKKIQRIKREVISIRKHVSPVRELMAGLLRSESGLIHADTHIYLRDVSDHTIRVIESVESHRDILSSLVEIYISTVSNRMNEVMKVLTVFASIFIPLTFLTGIYGMNFEFMPELSWRWAYPVLWVVFISISVGLLVYFKRRKWL
jgi:magnesium transporter